MRIFLFALTLSTPAFAAVEVKEVKLPRQPVIFRVVEATSGSMPTVVPATMNELQRALAERNVKAAGPGYVRPMPSKAMGDTIRLEVGLPVGAPVTPGAGFTNGNLPEGLAAKAVHEGEYKNIFDTVKVIQEWIRDNHREARGGDWEVHLDDVSKTPASSLRTEVFVPVKKLLAANERAPKKKSKKPAK